MPTRVVVIDGRWRSRRVDSDALGDMRGDSNVGKCDGTVAFLGPSATWTLGRRLDEPRCSLALGNRVRLELARPVSPEGLRPRRVALS